MNRHFAALSVLALSAGVIVALAKRGVPLMSGAIGLLLYAAYRIGQHKVRSDMGKKIDAVLARHNRDEVAS